MQKCVFNVFFFVIRFSSFRFGLEKLKVFSFFSPFSLFYIIRGAIRSVQTQEFTLDAAVAFWQCMGWQTGSLVYHR